EARDPRVRQDRVGVARLRVEAHEQDRVEVALEALHLAPAAAQLAALEADAGHEVVRVDVAHVAVRVADDDLVRAALDRALHDGVRVARHEAAEAVEPRQPAEDLLEALEAARPLHVDRDEHLHAPTLPHEDIGRIIGPTYSRPTAVLSRLSILPETDCAPQRTALRSAPARSRARTAARPRRASACSPRAATRSTPRSRPTRCSPSCTRTCAGSAATCSSSI